MLVVQLQLIDEELVQRRYPLVFLATMLEALLVWLHGDAALAAAIALLFCVVCALVLADKVLGGYGHPLAHLVLLPGCMVRTEALARRMVVLRGGRL